MANNGLFDLENITVIGDCQSCSNPIVVGVKNCRHCGAEIDYLNEAVIRPNALERTLDAIAVRTANTVLVFNPLLVLLPLSALIGFLRSSPWWLNLLTIVPAIFLLLVVAVWVKVYGKLDCVKTDFQESLFRMKQTLWRWLFANSFMLLLFFLARKDGLSFFR